MAQNEEQLFGEANQLKEDGDFDASERLYQDVIDRLEGKKARREDLSWVKLAYADLKMRQGEARPAFELLNAARPSLVDVYGQDSLEVSRIDADLGCSLLYLDNLAGAETHLNRALKIQKKQKKTPRDLIAQTSDNLAAVLSVDGRHQEALKIRENVVKLYADAPHVDVMDHSEAINNLGFSYRACDEPQKAMDCYEKALAMQIECVGRSHPTVAVTTGNLSAVHFELGDVTQAKTLLEESLSVLTATLGAQHPDTRQAKENLRQLNRAVAG